MDKKTQKETARERRDGGENHIAAHENDKAQRSGKAGGKAAEADSATEGRRALDRAAPIGKRHPQ